MFVVVSAKVALIIGIDRYDNKYDLGPLPSCLKDAEDLCDVLLNYGYSLFNNQIIIGSKPPPEETLFTKMDRTIKSFFMKSRPDQMLLFYFSGHGLRTDFGYYLASSQADPTIGSGGFAVEELVRIMKSSPCRRIVCIIDACYSGSTSISADDEKVNASNYYNETWRRLKDDKIQILLSSRAYEPSESDKKGENSIFTKYLLEGINATYKTDPPSVNKYGYVTPSTLYDYVYDKVFTNTGGRQKPDYKNEGDANKIVIAHHKNLATCDPNTDTTTERIEKFSDLVKYYNIKDERRVYVRQQTIDELKSWIVNWNLYSEDNRKKILLITGVPGAGKSWFTFKLIAELFQDYEILQIKGNSIHNYPIGIGKSLYPIFILDEGDIGIEGIAGGVSVDSVCDIIQYSKHSNFPGPVILSVRQDTWNKLLNGSIGNCKKLQDNIEEKIVERKELELDSEEAIDAAEKVIRSFYEKVDRNQPPFNLHVTAEIKNKMIKKSGCNLVIIKIFLEKIGRDNKDGYTIVDSDVDTIASIPVHYILYRIFIDYTSYDKNPQELAGILAGLYYIAKSGSISVGSLYRLWRTYYENKSRFLPRQVFEYLKTFFGPRPNKWPPPLFDIDRYGSIISFHNSVDRTLLSLIDNCQALINQTKTKRDELDLEIGESNRVFIEDNLEQVRQNSTYINSQIKIFEEQYAIDIKNWIIDALEDWNKQKDLKENQTRKDPTKKCGKDYGVEIHGKDAYLFLSMFKEYIEPKKGRIDTNRYEEFRVLFENIFGTAYLLLDYENPEISRTVNRLLYHIFEKTRDEDNTTIGVIVKNKGQLLYQLGAYDTDLDLMLEDYFPDRDPSKEPSQSGDDYTKLLLIRRVGLSLMTIGRLNDADVLYSKSLDIAKSNKLWLIDAGKVLQLKAELCIHLGRLEDSIIFANEAISLYMYTIRGEYCSTGDEMWGVQNIAMGPIQLIICSLAYQAWCLHLAGCVEYASITFSEAEKLGQIINGTYSNPEHPNSQDRTNKVNYQNKARPMKHLRDLWGVYHADHLLKKSDMESVNLAKEITEENLEYAECNRLTEIISQCYRINGDIDMHHGNEYKSTEPKYADEFYDNAYKNYIHAIEAAQKTSHQAVLIEAYLGLGLFYIKRGDYDRAIQDYLRKVYDNFNNSKNYRFYKVDLEIALSKAYLGKAGRNNLKIAYKYADIALKTSREEIHYYWGEKEAKNIVDSLAQYRLETQ